MSHTQSALIATPCPVPDKRKQPPSMLQCPPAAFMRSTPRLASAFRRRHFAAASATDWQDWHWQLRQRVRDPERLADILALDDAGRAALTAASRLPVAVTPYYLGVLAAQPESPLRRTMLPDAAELIHGPGEAEDPLGEEADSPVPHLVHRYPDRVLLLASNQCAAYCRYCTRSRCVGQNHAGGTFTDLAPALDYIRAHRDIRDVLVSGGDPLLLDDDRLAELLGALRAIPHVQVIRLGSKVPAVLPQRITRALVRTLRRFHPLWMSLHFVHPDECTQASYRACARLADAGIPLGSQTVLLRGVNDDLDTMRELCQRLMMMRVRPYYIYQCDPILGSAHFRTPVERGVEIIAGLRGQTSGYAVPTFVIDAPAGGGKIPVMPDYLAGRDGDDLLLRNWQGGTFRYPDPDGRLGGDR